METARQERTPIFEALKNYVDSGVLQLHVPGHKFGKGLPELSEYIGEETLRLDQNAMPELDDLANPVSVIKESQELAAELFGADDAFFLVNGTTSGIITMFLANLRPGEEVILPRNVHKSTINALILTGAIPLYVPSRFSPTLNINTIPEMKVMKQTITESRARAIFVVHPTYYGFTTDLRRLAEYAHDAHTNLLVDEAHGSLGYFNDQLPGMAMQSGADMCAISIHKHGGSLTQSSLLLSNRKHMDTEVVQSSLNMLRTSSASYLLMASLELARKQLAIRGQELGSNVIELLEYARERINKIRGFYAVGQEICQDHPEIHAFDLSKLLVHIRLKDMNGFELEYHLRHDHNVNVELSDFTNIIAVISPWDTTKQIDRLVKGLEAIAKGREVIESHDAVFHNEIPETVVSPRDAFYNNKISVALENAVNHICGEMVMVYPPGIPIVCPGERIDRDIVEYLKSLRNEKCVIEGARDPELNTIQVLGSQKGSRRTMKFNV